MLCNASQSRYTAVLMLGAQVLYEDGDVEELNDAELPPLLLHNDEQPNLPFLLSCDTFVVHDVLSEKKQRWCLVNRTIGRQDSGTVLCTAQRCRDANVETCCSHVALVERQYPVPLTWEPGTLACNAPNPGNGLVEEFRPVTIVNLLHDSWPGQRLGETHLDVNARMVVIAAVLSDLEGTYRIVQG
jgi:hypothetical protein